MPSIEMDSETARALEFAARMADLTPGQLVARLVDRASLPSTTPDGADLPDGLAIFADYEGFRSAARFDPTTGRVDITSGPLAGRSFKTPTGAARAVVAHYKPDVSPHRNGWSFWFLVETGKALQTVRAGKGGTR